jgi:CRISPR-associated protein Csx16
MPSLQPDLTDPTGPTDRPDAAAPALWVVVTRHAGAAEWVQSRLGQPVRVTPHLHADAIEPGARYHGVFPLNLAAAICRAGAECWAIAMDVPPALRGQELGAAQLDALGARLVRYEVREVPD